MRIDARTGTPVAIYRLNYGPLSGTPEEMAKQYLSKNHQLLKMTPDLSELITDKVQKSPAGFHVRFYQNYKNIPIFGSDVVVSINKQNKITMMMSNYHPDVSLTNILPSVSSNIALNIAKSAVEFKGTAIGPFKTKLMILQTDKGYSLTYKVNLPISDPLGDWQVFVDANNGEVISVTDLAVYYTNGSGKVFNPDPLTTAQANYGDPGFSDNNDANSTQLSNERITVTLQDITLDGSTYKLEGPHVKLKDFEFPTIAPATRTDANFHYTRDHSGFEDVMVYYHIDGSQRYLQSMGFTNIQNNPIEADPHGMDGDDNSHYIPSTNQLAFGEGGVDDAEDADVILHEYGHAIQNAVVPGWGGTQHAESASIGEGFADYWAGSYSGIVSTYYDTWVYNWDGHNPFWSGRILNSTKKYSDFVNDWNLRHSNGEIWSATLWDIWNSISRSAADKIVIQSHYYLSTTPTMPDAGHALIQANQDLYQGLYTKILYTILIDHEIIESQDYLISNSDMALAYNNGRNIAKYGNNYFSVYEHDEKIFFIESNNEGETWSNPLELSDHGGDPGIVSKFPAIAERDGNIYVVWQENKDNTYNWVKFRCKYQGNWQNILDIEYLYGAGITNDFWPTIAVDKTSSPFEMTVAYRINYTAGQMNIYTRTSTSSAGSSWNNRVSLPGSDNGLYPSLVYTNGMPYLKIFWIENSHVYYSMSYFRYGINWSTPVHLCSGVDNARDGRGHNFPTSAVSQNGTIHTAWEGEDWMMGIDAIIYTKNINPNIYHEFGNYWAYLKPSLTGHSGCTASMLWYDAMEQSNIRKAYYDGDTWDAGMGWWGQGWGEVIGQNGSYPSVSSTNPPGGSAEVLWLNGQDSPYILVFGSQSIMQKSSIISTKYHRRIIAKEKDTGFVFAMQTGEFFIHTTNGDTIPIKFSALPDEKVILDDSSFAKYLSSPVIELAKDVKEISFYQAVFIDSVKGISSSGNIDIIYNIKDANTFTTLSSFSGGGFSTGMQGTFQASLGSNISSLAGRKITIIPTVRGLKNTKKLNYSLVHVYLDNDIKQTGKNVAYQKDLNSNSNIAKEFKLFQNYPNPFNPVTTISYQLPKKSFVNLSIYNVLGQKVEELVNTEIQAGYHSVPWNAKKYSSGVYVYKLTADAYSAVGKCILLK